MLRNSKLKNSRSTCFNRRTNEAPRKNLILNYMFIIVDGAISSFKEHNMPLIGIDACHLKDMYKGVLMTTMGLYGNSGQFSLNYGVIDKVIDLDWYFFLNDLMKALDVVDNQSKFTILSNRHKMVNLENRAFNFSCHLFISPHN